MPKCETVDSEGEFVSKKYSYKSQKNKDGKIYDVIIFSLDEENADSELSKDIYADKILWYNCIPSVFCELLYIRTPFSGYII